MADNNNRSSSSSRSIDKLLDKLDTQTQDLVSLTKFTATGTDLIHTQVADDLDAAIRSITDNDSGIENVSNITSLFTKVLKKSNTLGNKLDKSFGTGKDEDISNLFQSPDMMASLMETYARTKWIKELDNEFDMICKYMPKLQIALDIKRDAVLCSDSYTKEFLHISPKNENPMSSTNAIIQNNINEMKKKYNLEDNVEKWYSDTSKYGEEFVYCVPYTAALNQLLKRKDQSGAASFQESVTHKVSEILGESASKVRQRVDTSAQDGAINITFDKSKIIAEAVSNNLYLRKHSGDDLVIGLSETFELNEADATFKDHLKKDGNNVEVKLDRTIDDQISWEDDDSTASDGLSRTNQNEKVKNINGAVVRTIRHDKFIPIYIEDVLFGGYYIAIDEDRMMDIDSNSNVGGYNSITSMFNNGSISSMNPEDEGDMALRQIAAKISQEIDAAFINANVNLKKEIYLMLRYNDRYNRISKSLDMNVTFIPADDIHHLKFREDPETHRGISDLWDALVPAKQWIMLNMTSVLGWTTRGFDRRVYYVKQSLDTNTAQSLLNVISTIKKGNFGIRQMESINNILGVLGRFNDFVIPMGPSGDAPIVFDTMQGQQFDFPTELMQNLEESAVNSTEVSKEIVDSSTGMDFAVRYTMTNAKLLRSVLKIQSKVEAFCSELITKIYRFEYGENVDLIVTLPRPAFLSMTQGTQLLNSAVQYAEAISDVEMANEADEAKSMFKKIIVRKIVPSYLTDEEITRIKEEIKLDKGVSKLESEEDY